MANIGSMLGAVVTSPPKSQGAKRAVKPHTNKKNRGHTVTKGEKSVTQHGQQHGELLNFKAPTEHQLAKESAKREMRHATERWVRGEIGGKEHKAVHSRAKHVLSGRKPHEF
jgi:acetyl-CoA acetyltransferase